MHHAFVGGCFTIMWYAIQKSYKVGSSTWSTTDLDYVVPYYWRNWNHHSTMQWQSTTVLNWNSKIYTVSTKKV